MLISSPISIHIILQAMMAAILTIPAQALQLRDGEMVSAAPAEKLCWAHSVSWGMPFEQSYDTPVTRQRLEDRTIVSKWAMTDKGKVSNLRKQMETALAYGVDGFNVDVCPSACGFNMAGVMEKYFQAAEGLPFYIALCVDGDMSLENKTEFVRGMGEFLDTYGKHPNTCFVDGGPVVFVYRAGGSPGECQEIVDELAATGRKAYWLAQPQSEATLWEDTSLLTGYLKPFDGFFDFGVNGFPVDSVKQRLRNGRNTINAIRPGGILVGGVTAGYIGPWNGFYRPFMNTATMRNNWRAIMEEGADWVSITTWDDYIESTHFEPSEWRRDSLLRINHEYLLQWRGVSPPRRGPQVIVSYMEEVPLGDDWVLEIFSAPYHTGQAYCAVRLLDYAGNVFSQFSPQALPTDEIAVMPLRLDSPGVTTPRRFRIQCRVDSEAGFAGSPDEGWKELFPVTARPSTLMSVRTIYLPLDQVLAFPAYSSLEQDGGKLNSYFTSWCWDGKADLLKNGRVTASQEIGVYGTPETRAVFDLIPGQPPSYPEDQYVARFTRADNKIIFAPPILLTKNPEHANNDVDIQAIQSGKSFDETWPIWARSAVTDPPVLKSLAVRPWEIFDAVLPLDHEEGPRLLSRGWSWEFDIVAENTTDAWRSDTLPASGQRMVFSFDGSSVYIEGRPRLMPMGTRSLEVLVKPENTGEEAYIYSDQNRGLELGVTTDGFFFASINGQMATAAQKIAFGEWSQIAAAYDLMNLRLYVNGELEGETRIEQIQPRGNSIPCIGAKRRESQAKEGFFKGLMAGFRIYGGALAPGGFLFCSK